MDVHLRKSRSFEVLSAATVQVFYPAHNIKTQISVWAGANRCEMMILNLLILVVVTITMHATFLKESFIIIVFFLALNVL